MVCGLTVVVAVIGMALTPMCEAAMIREKESGGYPFHGSPPQPCDFQSVY
jgi:hypothetical protein